MALGPWKPWRERALSALNEHPRHFGSSQDTRIQLLLAEGELQQAWDIARDNQIRLSLQTWERLAPAAEAVDPPGALRVYRTLVTAAVDRKQRQGYLTAIRWLAPLQRLHQRLDTSSDFETYLQSLRQTHRAKRSFVGLLDKAYPRMA